MLRPRRNTVRALLGGLALLLAFVVRAVPADSTTLDARAAKAANAFMCMLCKNVKAPGTALACDMGPVRRATYLEELRTRYSGDSLNQRDIKLLIALQAQLDGLKPRSETPEAYAARRDALIRSVRERLMANPSFRSAADGDRAAKLEGYITNAGLRALAMPQPARPAAVDTVRQPAVIRDTVRAVVQAPAVRPVLPVSPPAEPPAVPASEGGWGLLWWLLGGILVIVALLLLLRSRTRSRTPVARPMPAEHEQMDMNVTAGRPRIARTVLPPGRDMPPRNPSV